MARKSYGGDMFSPLRNDLSCLEGLKSSESDCSLELSKISSDAEKDEHAKNKEKFSKRVDESRKNSAKEHCRKVVKTNGSLSESSSSHSITSEEMPCNKISYITTRNKKSYLSENNEHQAKDLTADQNKSSKRSKKDNLIKHITLRSESSDKLLKSKTKQRESFSSTLSSLAEENFEKETFCSETVESQKNLDLLSGLLQEKVPSRIKSEVHKDHLNKITRKSNSEKQGESVMKAKVENKNFKSVVSCEVQTDVVMSELSIRCEKKCFTCQQINVGVDVSNPQNCNQVQQIQANIIEKLVKDTVSLEFEEIRQMMYLMQLSLFKRLDRISENQQSSDHTVLMKVIEELVEENQRLKQIINVSQGT